MNMRGPGESVSMGPERPRYAIELKSCDLFQWFCTSLATRPPPPSRAGPAEWRNLARTFPWNMHSVGPVACGVHRSGPARNPADGVDDRPDFATTRSFLVRLLSWRCRPTLGVMWLSQRELSSQIQVSFLNSLKFSILQIRPGPFLKVT